MKKMVVAGLVALALVASARQQASAWAKFNFGVGLNIGFECGKNDKNDAGFGGMHGAPPPGMVDGAITDGSLAPMKGTAEPLSAPMPAPSSSGLKPTVAQPASTQAVGYFQQAPADYSYNYPAGYGYPYAYGYGYGYGYPYGYGYGY